MTLTKSDGTALGNLYRAVRDRLAAEISIDCPSVEARWILEHVLHIHVPALNVDHVMPVADVDAARVNALVDAYLAGTPLPYLFGEWDFFGLTLTVTPAVLIPRPESEKLVELAAEFLERNPDVREFADVGTGSGCIAVSLLMHKSGSKVNANLIDRSAAALSVAKLNLERYHVADRTALIQGHLTEPLSDQLHLVIANLPYIPSARIAMLDVSANEPVEALDGGEDGFMLIDEMLRDLEQKIVHPFLILCEIDDSHREIALERASRSFPYADVRVENDFADKTRYLIISG